MLWLVVEWEGEAEAEKGDRIGGSQKRKSKQCGDWEGEKGGNEVIPPQVLTGSLLVII